MLSPSNVILAGVAKLNLQTALQVLTQIKVTAR